MQRAAGTALFLLCALVVAGFSADQTGFCGTLWVSMLCFHWKWPNLEYTPYTHPPPAKNAKFLRLCIFFSLELAQIIKFLRLCIFFEVFSGHKTEMPKIPA
ncbi:hypothetical protein BC351_19390 [Paenibacillus ferrarius]|uniref:Secreted protein n=1 Tax=Paenibacillus ferrarius TaxID=1469647 RepID=A0A1V4HNV1_9BACL|nr:hypothetical protein BC351_19390 [Paenibacillus ferrarius]